MSVDFESLSFKDRQITNSNGDVLTSSLGLDYALRTTSAIRAEVVKQAYYEVPIADFFPVKMGTGAWLEDIKTNQEMILSGPFERGIISLSSPRSQAPTVDVALSPKTTALAKWRFDYTYSIPEIKQALASNNWDLIRARMEGLKKVSDLGLQKLGFLGLQGNTTSFPGLLTSPEVTVDTTTITESLSTMALADLSAFVAAVMGVYFDNANGTALPNTFVIPMTDYLGLGTLLSTAGASAVSRLEFLRKAFAEITQNPKFEIRGLKYGDAASNALFLNSGSGINRYCLYHNPDVDTTPATEFAVAMDLPVPFFLNPAQTANNWDFVGIGAMQFSGCHFYRPRTAIYFDRAAA